MKPSLPWRTLVASRETGRFTREELDAAVLTVMERQRYPRGSGRPMMLREQGPGYGSSTAARESTAEPGTQGCDGRDAAPEARSGGARPTRDGR
ncbi:MAG TPA: hypothetical protein VF541_13250 [Longimicrobium sp.]|jgi:hypothetical protein